MNFSEHHHSVMNKILKYVYNLIYVPKFVHLKRILAAHWAVRGLCHSDSCALLIGELSVDHSKCIHSLCIAFDNTMYFSDCIKLYISSHFYIQDSCRIRAYTCMPQTVLFLAVVTTGSHFSLELLKSLLCHKMHQSGDWALLLARQSCQQLLHLINRCLTFVL